MSTDNSPRVPDDGELGDDHGHPSRGVRSEGQAGEHLPARAADQPRINGRQGFAAGEKVTADTNVEFVFEDGSVVRLAKGSSIKEDKNCEAFRDKSRSFKGTLLLGLIWAKVSAVFGDQVIELPRERSVTGRRGTTFWIVPHKKFTTLTVSGVRCGFRAPPGQTHRQGLR